MSGTVKPHKRQQGNEADLIKAWKIHYKDKGWDKVARFRPSGKLGVPYILFKSKNIIKPEVRKEKWHKSRPIAPTYHHPMGDELLGLVGRALYFMASRMPGEHFVLKNTSEVPKILRAAMQKFRGEPIKAQTLDITGCFPNMPKSEIREAMTVMMENFKEEGKHGVSVPGRGKARKCTWKQCGAPYKWITFELMREVLDFSLDHAIFTTRNGVLIRQKNGIPMGDPLSPAMCIGTCVRT